MAYPTYEVQLRKVQEAFGADAQLIRTEEGLFEVRVLFDGYEQEDDESNQ